MSTVSSWKFYTTAESAWEPMLDSCFKAEKTIDIEQFAFGVEGVIFERLTEILRRKVEEGVRVRLLLDAIGSFTLYTAPIRKELEKSGIEIVFHKTAIPPSFKRLFPALLRDHRKLIVIDNREAHIGGVIIQERARKWRDTMVVMEGPIVEECQEFFNAAWDHMAEMKPIGAVISEEKREFYLAGNSFRLRHKHLYSTIVKAIATAKKSVHITTPYFALTRDMKRAFLYAQERGVEVILLLPRRSDNLFSDCTARLFYPWLLKRGIRIFHYTKAILHAKTITVDESWATVGSCNLDWLSIRFNYELNLISENKTFARQLDSIFEADLKESVEVTLTCPRWFNFWKN